MSISNSTDNPAAESLRPDVHRIAAHEMSRLWQAHGIIALVVHAIGDEVDNGGPPHQEGAPGRGGGLGTLEGNCGWI
jgi:hypothetical protein